MKKVRDYDITIKFLEEYEQAAIKNAEELLNDAKILLKQKSFARAYFLSVASIEETGKAYTAFFSRGRNLRDPGLKSKLQKLFEDHSHKIASAFIAWIFASSDPRKAATSAVAYMIDLGQGRETSMYVDASPDGSISMPSKIARPDAGIEAIRIADNCLSHTKKHIDVNLPAITSSFDDKMLCIGTDKLKKVYEQKDFWEFLLAELKIDVSVSTYSRVMVTYYENYLSKGKLFTTKSVSE